MLHLICASMYANRPADPSVVVLPPETVEDFPNAPAVTMPVNEAAAQVLDESELTPSAPATVEVQMTEELEVVEIDWSDFLTVPSGIHYVSKIGEHPRPKSGDALGAEAIIVRGLVEHGKDIFPAGEYEDLLKWLELAANSSGKFKARLAVLQEAQNVIDQRLLKLMTAAAKAKLTSYALPAHLADTAKTWVEQAEDENKDLAARRRGVDNLERMLNGADEEDQS